MLRHYKDRDAESIANLALYNDGGATPTDGTGGTTTGLTASLNTSTPLVGTSSYRVAKDASNRQGLGFSLTTDVALDAPVKEGQPLTVQFRYRTTANYAAGDVKMFVYLVGPNTVQALTGGGGTPLAVGAPSNGSVVVNANDIEVAHAPLVRKVVVAGESFAANTTWLVRWAVNGETAGRVYKADSDATSADNFYVVGIAWSTSAVSAGDNLNFIALGSHSLQSSDSAFAAANIGRPVFLTTAGAFSVTAPTGANTALVRVGMVEATNTLFVKPHAIGVL